MKFLVVVGRILFSLIFLTTFMNHFSPEAIGYAKGQGVPFPGLLVPASGIIAFIGAISIIFGFKTKMGAWLIILFLIPVTFLMHNFWTITDPGMRQIQQAMFMKNISILGGAFFIAYFGGGPFSYDDAKKRMAHPSA